MIKWTISNINVYTFIVCVWGKVHELPHALLPNLASQIVYLRYSPETSGTVTISLVLFGHDTCLKKSRGQTLSILPRGSSIRKLPGAQEGCLTNGWIVRHGASWWHVGVYTRLETKKCSENHSLYFHFGGMFLFGMHLETKERNCPCHLNFTLSQCESYFQQWLVLNMFQWSPRLKRLLIGFVRLVISRTGKIHMVNRKRSFNRSCYHMKLLPIF